MAGWLETMSYEVLCGVGARVPRLAVRGADAGLRAVP
jgi:alanine racemase